MSEQTRGRRTGIYRHNQFRNGQEPYPIELWPDVLRNYRRHRSQGFTRHEANLITWGYANGLRPGLTLTTIG